MKKLVVTDVLTGEEIKYNSWKQMANEVIAKATGYYERTRYLPSCNDWNLDYPQYGETAEEYKARLIDMAIGLQLI